MSYQTVEKQAKDLSVGDRILRHNVSWRVVSLRTHASGDIDVVFRLTLTHPLQSHQTYGNDDAVELITGGFPTRPNHLKAVREYARECLIRALK